MTGVNGSADPDAGPGWRWDVALSFAGAQRNYVGQVAAALKARGVRCFYDADEQVRLWGTHLNEELPAIYGEQSAVVVVFISADYAGQPWTRLERRAAFSRAVDEAGVYVLPARFDDTPLRGLLPDVAAINLREYTPEQFADLVVAKLDDLGISPVLAPGGTGRAPAGGVRVSEADPRRLGVHGAISVPGAPDDVLPEYVPRDVDAAEHGVRAKVTTAVQRGGFVLLVGGSSVGKTRTAVEAVKVLLPDWWLVHPAGSAEVAALARTPSPRTVVWLDELQRYLYSERGLTGAVVRALLGAPHQAVIIATLWPDLYNVFTKVPAHGGTDTHIRERSADPYAREREVLDLANVVRIGPEFSPAEQARARAAAARDPRLAVALEAAGYGLTQTLAAAPQLVARWQDAQTANLYGWAVLTAALDAARLGARAPLSADFMRAAAPGYCTSQQLAAAPGDWFEQALAYLTEKLHGAVAALSPAGSRIGQVDGHTVADYLIQHASRERRSARVPASTWDAVLNHLRDPADAAELAQSARNRLLYHYAIPLYRHAADAGDRDAALKLAGLLEGRGDLDGAKQIRADAGDRWAAFGLAGGGDLDEDEQILRARADAGDRDAAWRLVMLLEGYGDWSGAVPFIRVLADAGEGWAVYRLAELLEGRGDLDGAKQILRARADAGDGDATRRLVRLLEWSGDLDGAKQILRARADAGDEWAAEQLAERLAMRDDLDGLRARADAGDGWAAYRLAELLEWSGDLDGAKQFLRAWADVGDGWAARRLVGLLERYGDLDRAEQILRARARADADDGWAASRLVGLLEGRGDLDGAEQFLRAWADAGDEWAAEQLAERLAMRGDLDGLRARVDAGDEWAAEQLPRLMIKQGRGEEAEQLRRFGLNPDGSTASA